MKFLYKPYKKYYLIINVKFKNLKNTILLFIIFNKKRDFI